MQILIVIAAVTFALVLVVAVRPRALIAFLLFTGAAGGAIALASVSGADNPHFGITVAAPVLTSTTALIGIAAILFVNRSSGLGLLLAIAFGALMAFAVTGIWGNEPQQWAGLVHLVFAVIAYFVGRGVSTALVEDQRIAWAIALALALVFGVQLAFAIPQSLGVPIGRFPVEAATFASQGRALGLYNHPSTIGKVVLVSLPILLPISRLATQRLAIVCWFTISMGVLLTALTLSRANFVAVVVALLLWLLLSRSLSLGRRAMIGATVAALAVPFVSVFLLRISLDPDGGDRPELLATGLAVVRDNWLWGIGVNSYSEVVGRYDLLAASGFPVHNVFLLGIAEMGLPLAVAFFLPLIVATFRSIKLRSSKGLVGDAAWAYLCALPGLLLVCVTGWGMISDVLPYWYLSTGVTVGLLATGQPVAVETEFPTKYGAGAANGPR